MASGLPWIKFYTSDWRKDPNLARCSKAAKGFWIDCICILNETEVRGVFRTNGIPWSDSEIATAVGGECSENLACLAELLVKGVAARSADGSVFSRRMVRDEEKRNKCSEAGKRGGGNPSLRARPLKVDPKVPPKVVPKVTPKVASDSDFFQKSEESSSSELFLFSEDGLNAKPATSTDHRLDGVLERVTSSIHGRHPAVRRCGPKEISKQLMSIVRPLKGEAKIQMLESIDRRHRLWCETDDWKKEGGQFAKGLSNWLAPTQHRYLNEPPDSSTQPCSSLVCSLVTPYVERLVNSHPKNGRPIKVGTVRESIEKHIARLGTLAEQKELLDVIVIQHAKACTTTEWKGEGGRYAEPLDKWAGRGGWTDAILEEVDPDEEESRAAAERARAEDKKREDYYIELNKRAQNQQQPN